MGSECWSLHGLSPVHLINQKKFHFSIGFFQITRHRDSIKMITLILNYLPLNDLISASLTCHLMYKISGCKEILNKFAYGNRIPLYVGISSEEGKSSYFTDTSFQPLISNSYSESYDDPVNEDNYLVTQYNSDFISTLEFKVEVSNQKMKKMKKMKKNPLFNKVNEEENKNNDCCTPKFRTKRYE